MPNFNIVCPKCSRSIELVICTAKSKSIRETAEATHLDAYDWSVRAEGALFHLKAKTFGDLCDITEIELMRVPNCGKITRAEIKHALATMGLTLKPYEHPK